MPVVASSMLLYSALHNFCIVMYTFHHISMPFFPEIYLTVSRKSRGTWEHVGILILLILQKVHLLRFGELMMGVSTGPTGPWFLLDPKPGTNFKPGPILDGRNFSMMNLRNLRTCFFATAKAQPILFLCCFG